MVAQSIDGKKILSMRSTIKIFLCGFMGAGKSTFLEKFSGSDTILIDLDGEILTRSGHTNLGDYIDEIGWERFRAIEISVLKEILQVKKNMVISLGGGAFTENFRGLLAEDKNNFTVWLNTPLEVCLERILSSKDRPLVRLGDTYLRSLYLERSKDYQKCDIVLNQNEQESIKNLKDLISLMPSK